MKNREIYVYITILILVIFASILVFRVHYNFQYYRTLNDTCASCAKTSLTYSYPIHSDEWAQLSRAVHMMDNNALKPINPYTNMQQQNFEPGFTSFLAQFFTMTGFNPIYTYQYLPIISIIILLLSLILFCFAWTNSYWTGILSAIFFLSINNTINILGIWFFVPVIFSLFILFMYTYALITKKNYLAAIFFCLSIIVYPLLTIILAMLTIPSIIRLFKQRSNRSHTTWTLYWITGALFVTAIVGLLIYFKFDLSQIIHGLIFKYGWTNGFERIYSINSHFTILGWIFGIIGIYFIFRKRLEKHLLIPLIFCVGIITSWTIFKFSILIPYQRGYLYTLIFISIISGVGLYYSLKVLHYALEKLKKHSIAKFIEISIIAIVLCSVVAIQYHNYYKTTDPTFWPQFFVSERDINALSWINDNSPQEAIIMVPPQVVFASYPVAHRITIAVPPSTLESGNYQLVYNFYNSRSCNPQQDIIQKTKTTLVYSYFQIPCGFKELYEQDGIYLYKT